MNSINKIFIVVDMIQNFSNPETEQLVATGKSRRLPPDILRLRLSNRLESLGGNRAGYWSIRINDQWRLCFRFANSDAFDVEIIDYH
ncbi:MAG: type II toxin-antitoxin system RelE/ParE family toxin [Methylovulum sp.]|nr:type II toxin-antitoxin system RelE/ParE family toxin [Methylovulum sp.]